VSEIDTSTAAVQRLAEQCEERRDDDLGMADAHDELNNAAHAKAFRASARHHEIAATTLTALAGERDAAVKERGALRQRVQEAEKAARVTLAEAQRSGPCFKAILLIEAVKQADASRDAARAEAARLREALEDIEWRHIPDQPAAINCDELTWAQRHVAALRRIARAALGQESAT
jgi:hypothetical protein